ELGDTDASERSDMDGSELGDADASELSDADASDQSEPPSNPLSDVGSLANLTMLMLKDNQLTGSIPPELGNLPALTWLNMQDNQLSGTIPPELGGLTTLSGLLLADNRLTGSIPPELSGMTSLGSLYLGNNQLSGTIPDFLISMNLGAIDLSDNQFSGTLPTDFPDNPMLSELKLNGNRLSGTIPAVLGNLQNLHTLRLENNQLTGSLPVELGNLPMLRFFRANNNDLTGGIPEEFSNLSDLFTLDLSSNQLSGPIPPGLGDLTDLNTLLLSYNRLSGGIPAELGNIVWLRYLHLAGNQLSGAVPAGLTGIIELYELDISYNALYVEDAAVKDMLDSYVPIWSDTQTIAPTGLSAGASSAGGARLSWTPIRYSGGDGAYEVYVSTQSGGPWTYAGETADKTASYYDVSGLLSGEYYFVVRTRTDAHIFNQGDLTSAYGTEVSATALPPSIGFNRQTLSFGYVSGKNAPASQPLGIIAGKPQVTWSLTHDASWLGLSQVSGSGSYTLGVSITPTGLSAGTYTGTISMSAVGGTVAAGTVSVTLTVYDPHNGSEPFGDFSTPTENSIARGGIPVTGWALDDVEVKKVTIYRMENNSKMYVGDAVFVEGARPDVEAAYPGYPLNYRAGWGYLLLTNFLPDNGNGTVTLAAVAEDAEGNRVTLGTRTINCDNANAVKPFGAIDTPAQGGTASGSAFENWGWALTPAPNIIPTDGSTIDVWIDGVNVGNPTYDLYREDIAALFPGYGNSNGAIGYLALDCGEYADGVHTISWTATDDAGNADGIGSRYFTISNAGSRTEGIQSRQGIGPVFFSGSHADVPVSPVPPMVTVGFSRDAAPIIPRTVDGTGSVTIKEGGRIAIHIRKPYSPTDKHQMLKETDPVSSFEGTMVYKGKLYPLPIGSQLDGNAGQFYWLPGPGFIGPYRFEFIETTPNGEKIRHILEVIIEPALQ
ncbi:MAG: hypothetical protein GY765_32550, partial [bacterium]|nr:hypothetical protein [bacterium]